jgi:tryptophan-rich sensory protein
MANEEVCCKVSGTAVFKDTGVKHLCVLIYVIETPLTSFWNIQIFTAHAQCGFCEIIIIKFNIVITLITLGYCE